MQKKKLLIGNREISWLYFNERVLQEANDKRNPIIERVKFLGIFSNNLDEFFRVRVATISRMIDIKNSPKLITGYTQEELLEKINSIVNKQQKEFYKIYDEIKEELKENNIYVINEKQLNKRQGEYVKKYFRDYVRRYLFPILLNKNFDFTTLKDKSIYFAVVLSKKDNSIPEKRALIKIPTSSVSRFLILPKLGKRNYIILLDDVIRYCLDEIFSVLDYNQLDAYTIKITRDAELEIDDNISKSFMEIIQESVKQRSIGKTVRFVYDTEMPNDFLKYFTKNLKINKKDYLSPGGRYHNFKDFISFPNPFDKSLENPILPILSHKQLLDCKSIFSEIKKKDILLTFPYQSFQYIIDLLREASIDPKVVSIKMTIYRVATGSNVINALINAVRNGKDVSVFMEFQARFDEQANINWANKMQDEGVKIIDTFPGMKVHSKLISIRRREGNGYFDYVNIGTGNYNEVTAKTFSDMSLLTVDKGISKEVNKVFEILEADIFKVPYFEHLIVAPIDMRSKFRELINSEIRNARKGKYAEIIIKLNNIVDEEIIEKLYKASQAGVKINMIIRGTCVLNPGVKNLSENIKVISIVDKYLEHARVLVFYNGGNQKFYISSSDWMTRNFDHRIEVSCPIYDDDIKEEILDFLKIQLQDNCKARIITKDNKNLYNKRKEDEKEVRSQDELYKYFKKLLK
ncbi:MAG: polyphosphate kinase 1 [Bacteroidetes bacterium GWE2_29_8]|nr:MAG: polyphosphate kinase 1 [Bacteroidetes bacterium GWE2_29_8]